MFNCTAWVIYGYSKWDKAVIYTNLPGILLGMIYSFIYYRYAPDKSKFNMLHKGYLILTVTLGLSYFLLPTNASQIILGLVANCGSISVFGAPLSKLVYKICITYNRKMLYYQNQQKECRYVCVYVI